MTHVLLVHLFIITQVERYDALIESQSGANTRLIVFQSLLDVSGRLRNVFCVLLTVGLGAHLALMNQVCVFYWEIERWVSFMFGDVWCFLVMFGDVWS